MPCSGRGAGPRFRASSSRLPAEKRKDRVARSFQPVSSPNRCATTWECNPSIVTVHPAAAARARSLLAFLITAVRTKRPGSPGRGTGCAGRPGPSCGDAVDARSGLGEPPKWIQSVPAGSSAANGSRVAVQEIAESEVSTGCIVSAGTPAVVSLPTERWNGDCWASCRWRGVCQRAGWARWLVPRSWRNRLRLPASAGCRTREAPDRGRRWRTERRRTAAMGIPVTSVFALDRSGTYRTDSVPACA